MKKFLMPFAMAVFSVGVMSANVIGSQGFADIGTPTAEGSPTGDINSATYFTIGELFSSNANSGIFAGMPHQDFGAVSFNDAVGNSLSFGNSVFGTFSSTAITKEPTGAGFAEIYVVGSYTAGSYDPGDNGSASFTISFTQNPAHTGNISDSATFSIPPAAPPGSPEPASMVLMGSALVGLAMVRRRRKV